MEKNLFQRGVSENEEKTIKITSIGEGAFAGNKKLKKRILGKNISSIGAGAFAGCKNLKEIIIKSTKLKSANLSPVSFKAVIMTKG